MNKVYIVAWVGDHFKFFIDSVWTDKEKAAERYVYCKNNKHPINYKFIEKELSM